METPLSSKVCTINKKIICNSLYKIPINVLTLKENIDKINVITEFFENTRRGGDGL